MNAPAELGYSSEAFSPQRTRALRNSATTESADVLARRDRSLIVTAEGARTVVRFSIGMHEVTCYPAMGGNLPEWVLMALRSISERWGVQAGWDGYNARPTDIHLVVRLLNCLSTLMHDSSRAPDVVPLADGGVQAEWHGNGQDFEIVVPAGEAIRYYYFNETTKEEEGAELTQESLARARELIGRS
jgi:hypothetical protein